MKSELARFWPNVLYTNVYGILLHLNRLYSEKRGYMYFSSETDHTKKVRIYTDWFLTERVAQKGARFSFCNVRYDNYLLLLFYNTNMLIKPDKLVFFTKSSNDYSDVSFIFFLIIFWHFFWLFLNILDFNYSSE